MTSRILVSVRPPETRIALWSGDRLAEFRIERADAEARFGDVYRGRVVRVEKGLEAAFVEIGAARPGFLPLDELDRPPSDGEALTVQVVREGQDGKGARLTARPRLAGRLLRLEPLGAGVALSDRIQEKQDRQRLADRAAALPDGEGRIVLCPSAAGATADALAAEAAALRELWRGHARDEEGRLPRLLHRDDAVMRMLRENADDLERIVLDNRNAAEDLRRRCTALLPDLAERVVFRPQREWVPEPAEIREQLDAALEPEVPLPSGGFLLFESGRTLTAIDVNSGRQIGDPYGRPGAERALLRANLEAVPEIARQLRLRNLGGVLVVDFIDLRSREHRRRVVEALRAAVAADPAPCRIVGSMSPLGLVEMTRRRAGASLAEQLTVACPTCAGTGHLRREGMADGEI